MVKIALKKCSFWLKLHFYDANLVIFWERCFLGNTRSNRSNRSDWSDWTLKGGFLGDISVLLLSQIADLGLWLGWIWVVLWWLLLLLGFLGGEFLFVVFEVFA